MANATPQGMMDLILNTPRSPEVVETFRELLRTNPNDEIYRLALFVS